MEPNEDEINQVLEFLELDRQQDRALVIQALKNNRRDVQTVASQYFDDPISFRSKYSAAWDEGMFSGERDGNGNNTGISFHIESSDRNEVIHGVNPHMDGSTPGAPSRPPSRTNSKSPLGKAVEWATQDVHGHGGPSSQAQEDEDYQRAIRESAQEAGVQIPAQESGVIDSATSQPHFGPANRESYDQGNWAMVPSGGHETKLQASSTASERKRTPEGAPAFMIQGYSSHGQHNLGGLLTILHEIPLARNILLSLGEPQATYGYNREWWNGQEILPEHIQAKLASGELRWGEQNESLPNLEAEIHRIMAFLDATDRGYGTVSVLADMIAAGRGAEKQFYEAIAVRNSDKIDALYHKAVLTEVQGDSTEEEEVASFGLLEMEHPRTDYSTIKTLYESLDHVMWNDALNWNEIHEGSKMAMFNKTGETFVVKVSGDGPENSFDFPLEFHPEKYLSDRKTEAVRIQAAWVETKVQAERLRQAEQTLMMWRDDWNNKTYDKKDLVQKATAQWKTYREYLEGLGRFRSMEASGFDTDKFPVYGMAPVQLGQEEEGLVGKVDEAVRVAEKLSADLEQRLQWLKLQSELLQERQRFVGRLLTDPGKDRPRPMACKRYLLRGVATSLDVTYVCKRSEPDLIDLGDSDQPLDQWWRLSRAPDQSQLVEKVDVERVLRDMWQETKTPLVVYATETALNAPREPLSGPLERFVKADNKAFRQELSQEEIQDDQTSATMDVVSPTKRKHRSDSIDSMASNRASIGSIEMNEREDPFIDNVDGSSTDLLGQEMEERRGRKPGGERGTEADSFALMGMHQPVPGPADNSMATLDPVDEVDSSTTNGTGVPTPSTSTQTGGFSRTMSPDADVIRSPEMQERSKPSLFMAASPKEGDHSRQVDSMKMEMPEHQ